MPRRAATLGLSPSFGFGDRIGLATTGHAKAMLRSGEGIKPIFAQQSIREMTRTGRSPNQVMADAVQGAFEAGYESDFGADADHLKTPEDVDRTADAGFVFFTIDPSGEVDPNADTYSYDEINQRFSAIADEVTWADRYRGGDFRLPNGTPITLDELTIKKAAVKYGRAINLAISLSRHIEKAANRNDQEHEIELSVDETPQPTSLAEHYIIADQCLRSGMKLVSLAPRFVGDFEKGVDFKGDINAFKKSLNDHAEVARLLGPYKLSLHSGSDKLSIYRHFAKATEGRFHVKTAGTSYLEALRVAARVDVSLFREIIDYSRARYDTDKATYHVSATVAGVPAPADVSDPGQLESLYLGDWHNTPPGTGLSDPGRQILHCTFGSVLTDPKLGKALHGLLEANRDVYDDILAVHFGKHLEALKSGL